MSVRDVNNRAVPSSVRLSYSMERLSRSSIVATGVCTRYTRRHLKKDLMFTPVPTAISDTPRLDSLLYRDPFTPVVHQPTRTTANTHDNLLERICLFAGVFEQRRTTTTVGICLHTAEVAGSNPASPTPGLPAKRGIPMSAGSAEIAGVQQPCSNPFS